MSGAEDIEEGAPGEHEALGLGAAAGAAQDRAQELRQALEARAAAAREWAEDQGEVLREAVQTRPLSTLGLALGAAFLAGLFIGVAAGRRID